jgi:hypothetical protein
MGWERNYTTAGQAKSMRGLSRGIGSGYAGFAAGGYEQEADDIDANNSMARQSAMQQQAMDRDREMFERNMLSQEQQRRAYDSYTQRAAQDQQAQKFGLLSNLISSQSAPMGGMNWATTRPPAGNFRRPF